MSRTSNRIDLSVVNNLAELERLGWDWSAVGEDEIRVSCPVPSHEDETPSVNFNTQKGLWQCHAAGCRAKGDIASFIAHVLRQERGLIIEDLKSRYAIERVKSINPETVEKFHKNIKEAGPLLAELTKRGLTKADIRRGRLGFWKGRITIPIYDASGAIINVRRYLPGAPGDKKMQNTPGYGRAAIYQIDQLSRFDSVWICGGELKALVAARILNPLGVGAISVSAGEGSWDLRWNPLLKDKTVFICMDVDGPGKTAAKTLARFVHRAAAETYMISLPLDTTKYPKGDINDWVGAEKAGPDDFTQVMEDAEEFTPSTEIERTIQIADPVDVDLAEALEATHVKRRLRYNAMIVGFQESPFLAPKTVRVNCDKSQPNCAICPVFTQMSDDTDEGVEVSIPPYSEALLSMVDTPSKTLRTAMMAALGIPACKVARFDVRRHYVVRDVRLRKPQVFNTSHAADGAHIQASAYLVDFTPQSNIAYRLRGVTYPHPRTQAAVLLVDEAEQIEDNLSSFKPTPELVSKIAKVFRPTEWTVEAIEAKLTEIYEDLSYNVHGIFGRERMQTILDLTWYSILYIPFEGRNIKGWVNTVVLGDSAQGKTEMSSRLLDHYGCGERVECKNASAAGLIGGLQQVATKWFVSWGVIPLNDRGLVLLEEVKGLSEEELGRMTDMRSSGIAELPKIQHGRANARTRLVFISNPRDGQPISRQDYGIYSIARLFGGMEDVRRFDVGYLAAAEHLSADITSVLHSERPKVEHRATADVCRASILMAWTRSASEVEFEADAVQAIYQEATRLARRFSEAIPLVEYGSMRQKIARLSAALAAKTASYDQDATLIVREPHVQTVSRLIDSIYSDPIFGYLQFTEMTDRVARIPSPADVRTFILNTKYPLGFVQGLMTTSSVTLDDMMNFLCVDREVALDAMSYLVRMNCLRRRDRIYKKSAAFIQLLRELSAESLPEQSDQTEEF